MQLKTKAYLAGAIVAAFTAIATTTGYHSFMQGYRGAMKDAAPKAATACDVLTKLADKQDGDAGVATEDRLAVHNARVQICGSLYGDNAPSKKLMLLRWMRHLGL